MKINFTSFLKWRGVVRPVVLALILPWAGGCLERARTDGSGTIECTQVLVAPQVGGRILELLPQEGDALKKGALVARLDPADYELKRAEAVATLAQAQAQLDLQLAGSREEDIARARQQVAEAEANARSTAADLKRISQLFKQTIDTQKQLDDAQAASDRAIALKAQADFNLTRLLNGNRKEDIHLAQTAVDLARARLAQAEKSLADCQVFAPMDGVVTVRSRENGEMVGSGATLVTLSRVDEVWLAIYVPETRLAKVVVGQKAWVKADGMDKPVEGKITFVSPEAEFTPKNVQTSNERAKLVYRVKITIANPNRVFKPGMPADGYVTEAP
jgi:HlyD family secretion protein